jgi:hypothetical protein
MKRAFPVLLVIAACGVPAGACSLNPQPIPPSDLGDQSNHGDAGNGGGSSGGIILADAAAHDAVADALSESAPVAALGDASNGADTSSDAPGEADSSGADDASGDAPSDACAPSDAAWDAGTAGNE